MYAHAPDEALARGLRVTPATIRAWRSGKRPIPWWVPELLRLRLWQFDAEMRAVGYRRLGIAKPGQSAQVYTFAPIVPGARPAAPTLALVEQPEALQA